MYHREVISPQNMHVEWSFLIWTKPPHCWHELAPDSFCQLWRCVNIDFSISYTTQRSINRLDCKVEYIVCMDMLVFIIKELNPCNPSQVKDCNYVTIRSLMMWLLVILNSKIECDKGLAWKVLISATDLSSGYILLVAFFELQIHAVNWNPPSAKAFRASSHCAYECNPYNTPV